jgi:deoxyribodipyrimidine photo-lyase
MTTLVWFRQDLRLQDNPALDAATHRDEPVIPLYIWSPEDEGDWPPGAASRWWLHQSLRALDASLRKRGSRLILAKGPTTKALSELIAQTNATAVYWNRRYEPAARACSDAVERMLTAAHTRESKISQASGQANTAAQHPKDHPTKRAQHRARAAPTIDIQSFNSALLAEPHESLNQSGHPYRMYTPYMRRMLHELDPPPPLAPPKTIRAPGSWPKSLALGDLDLMPSINWYTTIATTWHPGEDGAHLRLDRFVKRTLANYTHGRELPAESGTSHLSPHLHYGEIGPRQLWHALGAKGRTSQFLRELIWREFAYHLLYHFPETTTLPMRPEFARFPWKKNARLLRAWQRGRTGVPMVDAGMRQLWATGFMHNRVRMIVGSFLVKNLLQPWQEGARWFWDTLVDADLASNTMNWQWIAGSGADAAPYFRVFNPQTQGERYDPSGAYVRKWLPERASLPPNRIHAPDETAIVDLAESREAALDAYDAMRRRMRT